MKKDLLDLFYNYIKHIMIHLWPINFRKYSIITYKTIDNRIKIVK
jgi:hypothetical protein